MYNNILCRAGGPSTTQDHEKCHLKFEKCFFPPPPSPPLPLSKYREVDKPRLASHHITSHPTSPMSSGETRATFNNCSTSQARAGKPAYIPTTDTYTPLSCGASHCCTQAGNVRNSGAKPASFPQIFMISTAMPLPPPQSLPSLSGTKGRSSAGQEPFPIACSSFLTSTQQITAKQLPRTASVVGAGLVDTLTS